MEMGFFILGALALLVVELLVVYFKEGALELTLVRINDFLIDGSKRVYNFVKGFFVKNKTE